MRRPVFSGAKAWAERSTFLPLCRARELLSDVRIGDVSITDAAREAGLSPFHFIRRFESVFGETPHRFRTRERLVAAQRLLAHGRSDLVIGRNPASASPP